MKRFRFIILLSFVMIVSCDKEKENDNKELKITMGSVCGWCVGGDSLSITKDKIHYDYFTPCDNNDYSKDTLTTKSDWDDLIKYLDMDKFQGININTCYVCADGCDTWISIKNGFVTHKIRYGYRDSIAIKDIKPFADKLNAIRTRFKTI